MTKGQRCRTTHLSSEAFVTSTTDESPRTGSIVGCYEQGRKGSLPKRILGLRDMVHDGVFSELFTNMATAMSILFTWQHRVFLIFYFSAEIEKADKGDETCRPRQGHSHFCAYVNRAN